MPNPESIMYNKAKSCDGWSKINKPYIGRSIIVGNIRNCNDDEPIIDLNLKKRIEKFLKNNNINEYELIELNNSDSYSFDIRLKEDVYNNFKESSSI
tara:strand:+ start:271 stop:561 length:291 start_codon:yes stop_codon:yes gene_type:complete